MMEYIYHTCCIVAMSERKAKPFSFCEECWIEQGSPEGVKA